MKSKSRFTPSYLTVNPVPQQPSGGHPQHPRPHEVQHIRPREVQHVRKVKSQLSWRWGTNNKATGEN